MKIQDLVDVVSDCTDIHIYDINTGEKIGMILSKESRMENNENIVIYEGFMKLIELSKDRQELLLSKNILKLSGTLICGIKVYL